MGAPGASHKERTTQSARPNLSNYNLKSRIWNLIWKLESDLKLGGGANAGRVRGWENATHNGPVQMCTWTVVRILCLSNNGTGDRAPV